MEQQRRVSYTQHPAGVSSSSVPAYFSNPPASSHPRRPHNPFPGGRKVSREPGQPVVANYLVMIFPYTVSLSIFVSCTRSITYPHSQHSIEHGAPLLTFQRLVQTMQRFAEWNFSPRVALSSAKEMSVFPQLNAQIVSHSKTHNLVWTQRAGSTASVDTIDKDYSDCPFVILTKFLEIGCTMS
jgi:hypothetical protein